MNQTPTQVRDLTPFANALRLHPTVEAVVEHNVAKLQESGKPIATIKAVHTGVHASKAPADDAGGLESVVCLAQSARVMLISNLWVQVGLVNGAMGTVEAICYRSGGPPALPLAVMVRFDNYSGPTLHDGTVPITPIRCTWSNSGCQCSRLQIPLRLAWAVTIHKSQGLTLDKVVIDVGKREFSCGLTYVACSRVRRLADLLFSPPLPFQRLASIANSQRLHQRKQEDRHLLSMQGLSASTTCSTAFNQGTPAPPTHELSCMEEHALTLPPSCSELSRTEEYTPTLPSTAELSNTEEHTPTPPSSPELSYMEEHTPMPSSGPELSYMEEHTLTPLSSVEL